MAFAGPGSGDQYDRDSGPFEDGEDENGNYLFWFVVNREKLPQALGMKLSVRRPKVFVKSVSAGGLVDQKNFYLILKSARDGDRGCLRRMLRLNDEVLSVNGRRTLPGIRLALHNDIEVEFHVRRDRDTMQRNAALDQWLRDRDAGLFDQQPRDRDAELEPLTTEATQQAAPLNAME